MTIHSVEIRSISKRIQFLVPRSTRRLVRVTMHFPAWAEDTNISINLERLRETKALSP